MKTLLLTLMLLALAGCADDFKAVKRIPRGVEKFKDGDVTCYTYYDKGISCLKDTK